MKNQREKDNQMEQDHPVKTLKTRGARGPAAAAAAAAVQGRAAAEPGGRAPQRGSHLRPRPPAPRLPLRVPQPQAHLPRPARPPRAPQPPGPRAAPVGPPPAGTPGPPPPQSVRPARAAQRPLRAGLCGCALAGPRPRGGGRAGGRRSCCGGGGERASEPSAVGRAGGDGGRGHVSLHEAPQHVSVRQERRGRHQSSRVKAKSDFVGSASLIKSILQAIKSKGQGSRSSEIENKGFCILIFSVKNLMDPLSERREILFK
nr:serine/arginine-rich splicing factor 12 isoform X2 [Oryctolagus cuniculus]